MIVILIILDLDIQLFLKMYLIHLQICNLFRITLKNTLKITLTLKNTLRKVARKRKAARKRKVAHKRNRMIKVLILKKIQRLEVLFMIDWLNLQVQGSKGNRSTRQQKFQVMIAEENSGYTIRPNFKQKFRPYLVNKIIHQILQERLNGATYHPDTCSQWGREISDEIKLKLKDLQLPRYKYVVNVIIGEKRGEGVRIGARSFYDGDTDSMAQSTFMNESLFCVAMGNLIKLSYD
jgi:hypothetical protein